MCVRANELLKIIYYSAFKCCSLITDNAVHLQTIYKLRYRNTHTQKLKISAQHFC